MNCHSNIKSSFVSCDFVQKNKAYEKNQSCFRNKLCKIKKNVGSFGKCLLKSKKGTDFKLRQILKNQERSKDNLYTQYCPKCPSLDSDNSEIKKIPSNLCDQLHDIAAENLNLLSLGQTAMGAQSGPNYETKTSQTDCSKERKTKSSLQAHNERTVTYCNSRQIASIQTEPKESLLNKTDKIKANIELRENKTVHNAKGDNKSDILKIGVENDAAQESDDLQSFGNIIAKCDSRNGDSNVFLVTKNNNKINSVKTEIELIKRAANKCRNTKEENFAIIKEDVWTGSKLNKAENLRENNKIITRNTNENGTSQCDSSLDRNFVDPRTNDVTSDHTYMRQLSVTQDSGRNDHNNNDNDDILNSTNDENDETLFVQIDQSKIKAVKNEILSSFRILTKVESEEITPEKIPVNENKKKRKLDCDHYDKGTKKIKLKDQLENKRKNVHKHKNTTKVCSKRNIINFSLGDFTVIENVEKMDTDDSTEIPNKKILKKGIKEENVFNESLISDRSIDSEIMDICEENEIMINDESSLRIEELEEMESEAKQNADDELSDVIDGASDDLMGTSDADSRTQFTRNWYPSEFFDTETSKWKMDTDESANEKLENKMEEVNESLYEGTPKEDYPKLSEDRKTRLRPRNYRSFLLTKEKRSRAFLKQRSRILGRWFVNNFSYPYPSKIEKDQLAIESNMPRNQVSEWFGNMRRRIREATRGQHLTWEEKVKRYNNLISGKSEPLPILPGDLINRNVDEGIETGKHLDVSFTNEVLSPKFKRNLLQRYMNDFEIKSLPYGMKVTEEELDSKMKAVPNVSANVFKENEILSSNSGKAETSKEGSFYLFPIWREIRINTKEPIECVNALEGINTTEVSSEGNEIDCHSTICRPIIKKHNNLTRKRRIRTCNKAFNHDGIPKSTWTQLPNDSRVFLLAQKDSDGNTAKLDHGLQFDEDSNGRPCSISKRTKTNPQSNFLDSGEKSGNSRSSDEIEAAYSLMELRKIL